MPVAQKDMIKSWNQSVFFTSRRLYSPQHAASSSGIFTAVGGFYSSSSPPSDVLYTGGKRWGHRGKTWVRVKRGGRRGKSLLTSPLMASVPQCLIFSGFTSHPGLEVANGTSEKSCYCPVCCVTVADTPNDDCTSWWCHWSHCAEVTTG